MSESAPDLVVLMRWRISRVAVAQGPVLKNAAWNCCVNRSSVNEIVRCSKDRAGSEENSSVKAS